MQEDIVFFIPGDVPSSKNGKRWTGSMLINSKTVMRWYKNSTEAFKSQKEAFLLELAKYPMTYYIEFTFIRRTKHKFDYVNKSQIVLDGMAKLHGWLPDDDADTIKPYFGDYKYDKRNPGVEIRILKDKPKHY